MFVSTSLERKRANTHVLVGLTLPGQVGRVGGRLQADVELGQGNLNAEIGEALDGVNVLVEGGVALGDEVGLEADAVNADALLLEHADDALGGGGLGAGRLKVVVVDVELGMGVDLGGRLEGELDVLLAEHLVEDRLAVGAVLVQHLVDDVPGVALAAPVAGDLGDVVDNDLAHLGLGPVALLDPLGQLAVPDERVAAQVHAVLAGLGRHDVALGVVPDALRGADKRPLWELVMTL